MSKVKTLLRMESLVAIAWRGHHDVEIFVTPLVDGNARTDAFATHKRVAGFSQPARREFRPRAVTRTVAAPIQRRMGATTLD